MSNGVHGGSREGKPLSHQCRIGSGNAQVPGTGPPEDLGTAQVRTDGKSKTFGLTAPECGESELVGGGWPWNLHGGDGSATMTRVSDQNRLLEALRDRRQDAMKHNA